MLALLGIAGCAAMEGNSEFIQLENRNDSQRARELNRDGVQHVKQKELAEAEASFKKAIYADVTFGPAHNNMGRVYFHKRNLKLAALAFERAMEFMPERPEPINNLGLTYESAGRLGEAIELYQTAHYLQPHNPEYLGNLYVLEFAGEIVMTSCAPNSENWYLSRVRPPWVEWAEHHLAVSFNQKPASIETDRTPEVADTENRSELLLVPPGEIIPHPMEPPVNSLPLRQPELVK